MIHRFTRTVEIEPGVLATVEDDAYAELSLRMRDGAAGEPAAVFDDLAARGQVRLYSSEEQLRTSVAKDAAAPRRDGRGAAVSVATNDAARALNAATGDVDDGQLGGNVATTGTGQRIGAGDLIATRDNDRDADVANRDTWTVTAVHDDGSLTVTPTEGSGLAGERTLAAGYVNRHVELGYAGTIHSVQGETAHAAHLVLDEHTSAAAAYVGMTRGRTANTVHLLAEDLDDARAQWIDTAGRGRADLGINAARQAAEQEAARYAHPSPTHSPAASPAAAAADPRRLAQVLDQLRAAWTEQANAAEQLEDLEPRWAEAKADHDQRAAAEQRLAELRDTMTTTRAAAAAAEAQAVPARAQLEDRVTDAVSRLRPEWDADRQVAAEDARILQTGPGLWSGITKKDVTAAAQELTQWAEKWRQVVPELTDLEQATYYTARHPGYDQIDTQLPAYLRDRVYEQMPSQAQKVAAAPAAAQLASDAADAYTEATTGPKAREAAVHAAGGWHDRAADFPQLDQQVTDLRDQVCAVDQRLDGLTADPAIETQPDPAGWLDNAHHTWRTDRDLTQLAAANRAASLAGRDADESLQRLRGIREHDHDLPDYGHDVDRDGPSFGR